MGHLPKKLYNATAITLFLYFYGMKLSFPYTFLLILLCICNSAAQNAPVLTATGNQLYCPGSPLKIVTDFNITDPVDPGANAIYIQISSGYINGQDLLSLTGNYPTLTTSWNAVAGKLTLQGTGGQQVPYATLIAAVKDIVYTNTSATPSAGTRSFSITIGQANYLPSTGHYYRYIPALGISWTAARNAAAASTYYGLQGYLATLLSAEEAQLCGEQATGTGWIGGSDDQTEGVWRWVTGPETGTVFWNGGVNGSTPNFAFWNNGEPNNQNNEDYAHITAPGVGIPGSWNDLTLNGESSGDYQPKGYIVEYGGMPGDPVLNISASTSISIPAITSTSPASLCGTGTVTLNATAGGGATIYWYATPSGGTPLATGNSFTTPVLNSTTTYYASAYSSTCTAPRSAVTATVQAVPALTVTNPIEICGAGTATLQATSTGNTINWYNAPTGGNFMGTGSSLTTPPLSSDTTYYAQAVSSNGCTSARMAVNIVIKQRPSVILTTTASICGPGTVQLTATPSAGIVNWYDAVTGGNFIGTGNTITSPPITTNTTFYAEALDNGCTSVIRVGIAVTVHPVPTITAAPNVAVCYGGNATVSATPSAGTIKWYFTATGGSDFFTGNSFPVNSVTTNQTFYAEAFANGCPSATRTPVNITISSPPTLTVTTPASLCGPGTATLQATPSEGSVNWYDVQTGGTPVGTGNSFTTPVVNATTTYYAEAVNNAGCGSSARQAVTVTVNPLPTVTATTPPDICAQGTATLQANAAGSTINWYDAPTGGTLIGTGSSITSPSLTATTTFYAEAVSSNNCVSAARATVTVTVNPAPVITVVSTPAICEQGATTLEASASAGTISWYDSATGGTLLATGTTFTTPVITSDTIYYIEATDNGCTTPVRTAVTATVLPLPTLNATSPVVICSGDMAVLTAAPSAGTVNWYTDASGGTLIATGSSFTTPALTAGTVYYAEAENNGCVSLTREAVSVTVNSLPFVTDEDVYFCEDAQAALDATTPGATYVWDNQTTAAVRTVRAPGVYTVTITNASGCSSIKTFTVYQYDKPVIDAINVSSGTVTVLLENDNPANYQYSLNGATYQTSNTFTNVLPGVYTVYVKEDHDCGIASRQIIINMIPAFITPNGDNYNDVLSIRGISAYPNATLTVFDRYGKIITFLSRSNNRWDGTYNNRPLPATDYWYIFKMDDKSPEIRGHFALMR